MPPPNVIPWGLHPLQSWVIDELKSRAGEVGMNTDVKNYSGPKTAWARFFSNGIAIRDSLSVFDSEQNKNVLITNHEGFVMGGTHGFNDSYGFNKEGRVILGYDADGLEHSIPASMNSSFPHRPPPSIESIDVSLFGGQNSSFTGLCRKARVNWKCYSLDQLEYLAPYFLSPKVTMVLEWGWNNYNPTSLMDLTNKDKLLDTLLNGKDIMNRIELSKGNYDATLGFTVDYGFSMNALGGYDCFTEFVNANWLIEGQQYKNTSVSTSTKKADGTETPEVEMKTITEFVDTDINNFSITGKRGDVESVVAYFGDTKGKVFAAIPDKTTHSNAVGHTDKKIWLRMDLVEEIFNKFFSLYFKDIDGNVKADGAVLKLSKTVICGHQLIKSTNEEILIPNKFAPRLTTIQSELLSRGGAASKKEDLLNSITIGGTPYDTLFSDTGFDSFVKSKNLTHEFDDLQKVINPDGNSFPRFEKGDPLNDYTKNALPGTYGYLGDVFVSTKLIKGLVGKHDSSLRMLEELLQIINEAFSGIVQLKIIPDADGAHLSVIDTNYNPRPYVNSINDLVKITPGAVDSAYMTKVSMDVKISPDMMSQMVAQSSAGTTGEVTYLRVGVKEANRFVGNDRLYDVGTVGKTMPSSNSSKSKDVVSIRDFSTDTFFFYQNGNQDSKKYILIERDAIFMKSLLSGDKTGKLIYINSPILSGTRFGMETLGIGGFTFLGQFVLDHVPKQYGYKNCIWQIADITQKISGGTWVTEIKADCRPLSTIKSR